jgi:hypothetical protein
MAGMLSRRPLFKAMLNLRFSEVNILTSFRSFLLYIHVNLGGMNYLLQQPLAVLCRHLRHWQTQQQLHTKRATFSFLQQTREVVRPELAGTWRQSCGSANTFYLCLHISVKNCCCSIYSVGRKWYPFAEICRLGSYQSLSVKVLQLADNDRLNSAA